MLGFVVARDLKLNQLDVKFAFFHSFGTIYILLSLVATLDSELKQLDVKIVNFFNANLE